MSSSDEISRLDRPLPPEAAPATAIIRELRAAGHVALLNGGCVRDLLRGATPQDYDVATDAPPERVAQLFHHTRHVGAQFGVVLVRRSGHWIEVATFRSEGPYSDGRRPDSVSFSDARTDANRRDFTINGMFLDPLAGEVIDYVGGRADLAARVIRAIGDPRARFAEDHLRLLRAIRFAARLSFEIEPQTTAALRDLAPALEKVAAERVRDELERMFSHPSRAAAFALLRDSGLLNHLTQSATWTAPQIGIAARYLGRLSEETGFALAFAALALDRTPAEIETIARDLTFSNEERETVHWVVAHQADLDAPGAISLAALKRLMAHPAFPQLRALIAARHQLAGTADLTAALDRRIAAIAPDSIQPPPFVTGADLLERKIPQSPIYKETLDTLYTRQLNETLHTRDEALAALDALLKEKKIATKE